ncbi:hypothetical protein AVEN_179877-1, partial [Araneus ventricosus]
MDMLPDFSLSGTDVHLGQVATTYE